jgi:hypothetical protein
MAANHFILKLVLAPLIIAAATLVSRRWGERIGGLLIGLPLTSAPVSVFFAVEQGPQFAASAALGSLLGMVPVAVFCLSYVQAARRLRWYYAALFSVACYLLAVGAVSFIPFSLGESAIVVPVVLGLALLAIGSPRGKEALVSPPWWDLPLRMVISAALLVVITTLAGSLGSKWSGLLSPFPVFSFVMATFSHSQGGPGAAWRFMRGLLTGLFGYTVFFLVVGLLMERTHLVMVYVLATLAALAVYGISLARLIKRSHKTITNYTNNSNTTNKIEQKG